MEIADHGCAKTGRTDRKEGEPYHAVLLASIVGGDALRPVRRQAVGSPSFPELVCEQEDSRKKACASVTAHCFGKKRQRPEIQKGEADLNASTICCSGKLKHVMCTSQSASRFCSCRSKYRSCPLTNVWHTSLDTVHRTVVPTVHAMQATEKIFYLPADW